MAIKFSKPIGTIQYDILKKKTDLLELCADFYLLISMKNIAEANAISGKTFLKSRDKFVNDIRSVHEKCVVKIENLFLAYFPVAVFSEIQSGGIKSDNSKPADQHALKLLEEALKDDKDGKDVVNSVKEIAPTCERAVSLFASSKSIFSQIKWKQGFGGKKWEQIANTALMRLRGQIDSVIFIDTSFNIEHHSGHIFDKHENINCPDSDLIEILSIKRDESLGKIKKLTKKYASSAATKLFERGVNFNWWEDE